MSFWVAGAIVGGAVISGVLGNQAAKKAASASQQATDATVAEQARQFDINQANQAPYLKAGTNALATYQSALKPSTGSYTNPAFSFNASDLQNDPAYKFALDQAMQATDRAMKAGGYGGSGNILAALQDRAQGVASQQYQNAFGNALNTYNTNSANSLTNYNVNTADSENYLNRLAAEAGIGQTAANQVGSMGANMASNIGNANMQNAGNQGNAADLQYGSWNNAVQGGVGNYLGYRQNQQLLNLIQPNPSNAFYTWNG